MNKKGVLFTITTFLLLWSLFMLTQSYTDRNRGLQELTITSTSGDKIRFLEDDITNNIYYDLVDFSICSVSRDSENITIIFIGPVLSKNKDHFALMQEYETFIEGSYSDLNNINLELTNFTPSFTITPYSNNLLINKTELKVTTQQPSQTRSIQIEIVLNTSIANLTTNSTPTDSGEKMISVQILDKNKNHLLDDEVAYLDSTISNQPFYVEFSDNSSLEVKYGNIFDMDGSLAITANNLIANITNLKFTYNLTFELVRIKSGEIQIDIPNRNLSKQAQIMLFVE